MYWRSSASLSTVLRLLQFHRRKQTPHAPLLASSASLVHPKSLAKTPFLKPAVCPVVNSGFETLIAKIVTGPESLSLSPVKFC